MKHDDRVQRKIKPSSSSSLHPKSVAMSRRRGVPSKTEKKKSISALSLTMQKLGIHSPSTEEENLALETTRRIKPAKRKRVDQSTELCRYSDSSAMKRAEEFQSKLSVEYPSFIKYLLPSHVSSCFWLGLPTKFCDRHLPITDTVMDLIDQSGVVFNARYLAAKVGLSGGWRSFSVTHKLAVGDVLVFHLVQRTVFKVYIIRRSDFSEIDGALGLLDLDTHDGGKDSDVHLQICSERPGRDDGHEDMLSDSPSGESHGSEVLDWIRFSESESVSLESFDKFSIRLDGSVAIDVKFSDHIRQKYYDLCTDQSSFLHEKLLKGLSCTLVVGIISETINISDAIRANNREFPESDLLAWDRTLHSFELLGMQVGFIRTQIHELLDCALERDEAAALEAKTEREVAAKRMKTLEVEFSEVRKQMEEIDNEIEMMEESTKRKRMKLQHLEN